MYGAILGDMVGAPYEFDRGGKSKNFKFWSNGCRYTDDSVMSIAVADALIRAGLDGTKSKIKKAVVAAMQDWGRRYPDAGYGGAFRGWLRNPDPKPYNSWGNGSAMRVSAVGWLYDSLERTREVARLTAEVTHNHPEGIKGAEATVSAIFMARNGASKKEIREYITDEFHYDLSRTCDEIRPTYRHVESCQETVPEALTAFLEGEDFEDVIRTAVSLGGDCDTLTCIAGGIAEAFYGIPHEMKTEVRSRLEEDMREVLDAFDGLRRLESSYGDDYLKWNCIMEEAIAACHRNPNHDSFFSVLESIYYRMHENGCLTLAALAPQETKMVDWERIMAGENMVRFDTELRFKFQHLNTEDGKLWAVAYTSDEEYRKGPSTDALSMGIREILEGFSGECAEEGIIINPWGESFRLSKEHIRMILAKEKPKNDIKWHVGDITKLPLGAIVNAANSSLSGGGGVDGAIHRAAGRELLDECRKLPGCMTGEAVITKGYQLPAKHVIHTVGPVYSGNPTDAPLLFNCYYNSLELAAQNHIHSIAFPGISTGVYGYPKEEAAEIALAAIVRWFEEHEDYGMQVVIVNFSEADYQIYEQILNRAKDEEQRE